MLGPLTALRFAADQLSVAPGLALGALARDEARATTAAERDALAASFRQRTDADAARLAGVGSHSIDNPAFVDFLVHDATGAVRPSLRGVFPDRHHALMVVRLGGDLTIDQQGNAADRVVSLVRASHFDGIRAVATGTPLLVKQINDRMRGDMALLGGVAALSMAVVLLLVFRVRWRLLSLAVMALGVVWAFGAIGYLGIPLTMVTISGLPILIGLGVDFAVQIHSRYEDELIRDPDGEAPRALGRTLLRLGPAVTVAAIAAVVGFLALRTSNVPMVRDFGVLLSIGTAAVFAAALFPMPAVLVWRDRHRRREATGNAGRRVERATRALATAGTGRPLAILVVSIVVVLLGPFAMGRVSVESDPERWVPQDSGVLHDLQALRRVAGSSAELGLMVEAPRRAPADRAALDVGLRGPNGAAARRPARELHERCVDHLADHGLGTDRGRRPHGALDRARSHPAFVHQRRRHPYADPLRHRAHLARPTQAARREHGPRPSRTSRGGGHAVGTRGGRHRGGHLAHREP